MRNIGVTLLLALLCWQCESADELERQRVASSDAAAYIQVRFDVGEEGVATKAGMEEGETLGTTEATKIDNLLLLLYQSNQSSGNGINADGSILIDTLIYFANTGNNQELIYYYVETVPAKTIRYETVAKSVGAGRLNKTYDLLALANVPAEGIDGIRSLYDAGRLTLEKIRSYAYRGLPWYETGNTPAEKNYSFFTMVSAGPADTPNQLTLTTANTIPDQPAVSTPIALERLTARVEYERNAVEDKLTTDGTGKVYVRGAVLVNQLSASVGSRLFKLVDSSADGSNGTYLGKETDGNYVVDVKGGGEKRAEDFTHYFTAFDSYLNDIVPVGTQTMIDSYGNEWHRVGYTLENTNGNITSAAALEQQATGVVFAVEFVPTALTGYTRGQTFFEFNNKLYTKLSDAMTAFEGSESWKTTVPTGTGHDEWQNYANSLKYYGPAGYRTYLQTELDANRIPKNWDAYMQATYGYSENGDGTVTMSSRIEDRKLLSTKGGTRTFYNGVCYYTWWIKHNPTGAMPYAVVRNNVYRLKLTKISGLGSDLPGEETLDVSLTVAPWQHLGHEDFNLNPNPSTTPGT